jgi:hypothetical protein
MSNVSQDHLVDIEEIHQLRARYARFLDLKDWSSWRSVFADDCVLEWPSEQGANEEIVGAERIIAFLRDRIGGRATAHHCVNPEITFSDGDSARGIWSVCVAHDHDGVRGYGLYHDEYIRGSAGWLLKRYRFQSLWTTSRMPN